jgi:hypothetical protein
LYICFEKDPLTDDELFELLKDEQFKMPAVGRPFEDIMQTQHEFERQRDFLAEIKFAVQKQGVSCFSTKRDNQLMWAHYTKSHTGVCIGYDSKTLLKDFPKSRWISYSNELPTFEMYDKDGAIERISTTKSEAWSYEAEIRLFAQARGPFPFDRTAIKEIIFGLRTPFDKILQIVPLLKRTGFDEVTVKKVIIKNSKFMIHFTPLEYDSERRVLQMLHNNQYYDVSFPK